MKLIDEGQLLNNILIVFVTDGVGEDDGIKTYITELSSKFE
jgi:hypothetical protein